MLRVSRKIKELHFSDVEFDQFKRIVYWSDRASRILGYMPEEVIGKPCYVIVSDEDKIKVSEIWQDLLSNKKLEFANKVKTRKGTEKYIKWVNVPHIDSGGKVCKICSFMDVVELTG